jgi:two-component system chemotaxis response regulator CheY
MAKKILAVDDSKTMRDMVTFTLSKAGFDVMEAADGQKALDVMRRTKFDLIITDINMPIMDGITLIKNVRTGSDHRGVPILILTTESDDAKKAAGKSAGATGWLVKPFSPDKLVELVNRVCP